MSRILCSKKEATVCNLQSPFLQNRCKFGAYGLGPYGVPSLAEALAAESYVISVSQHEELAASGIHSAQSRCRSVACCLNPGVLKPPSTNWRSLFGVISLWQSSMCSKDEDIGYPEQRANTADRGKNQP